MVTNRLTVALLVATALVLGLVPPAREWVAMVVTGRQGVTEGGAPAGPSASDARAWLGAAEWAASRELHGASSAAAEAYQRALEFDRASAVVPARYALYLASRGSGGAGATAKRPSLHTRGFASENVLDLLRSSSRLAPDNAAPAFLLASGLLQAGKESEVWPVLSDALARPTWSTYAKEAAAAALDRPSRGDAAQMLDTCFGLQGASRDSALRDLTLWLSTQAAQFRQYRRPSEAVFCYQCLIHLGRTMRLGAYDVHEGLTGVGATYMVAGSSGSGQEQPSPDVPPAFTSYLHDCGHDELAATYAQERAAAVQWQAEAVRALPRSTPAARALGRGQGYATVVASVFPAMALVAVVVLLGSVGIRFWREPRRSWSWRWPEWLALLMVCLAPSAGLALLSPPSIFIGRRLLLSVLLGATAWLVAVGALSWRRAGKLPPPETTHSMRAVLAAYRRLLPPTLAALLLLVAGAISLSVHNLHQIERQQRQVMLEGEVQYYRIGDQEGMAERH